ncbi:acyl-CoA thioesterase [Williamsia soli]|uniref:acyl-CoA thioesterase n=1 Tax=Williamsia soli TaxID=364929 RepID=UPI0027DB526C|nr:thioesterase family protein [Williamsia soli]
MTRPALPVPQDYPVLWPVPTRWDDNDHYGHVNNVTYYSYFDTAVNAWLMSASGTDIRRLAAIGIVAETSCIFHSELTFPEQLQVGLSIERLGTRSVVYSLAIFAERPDGTVRPAATGRFVHVYVDRDTRKPTEIPPAIATAVAGLASAARNVS